MTLKRVVAVANKFTLLSKGWFWAGLVVVMIALTTVTTGSLLEDHDQFCASCHMQPEDTYDQRAQLVYDSSIAPIDLASQHYMTIVSSRTGHDFRCIDCHRGDQMLGDRATALFVGAGDLVIYFAGAPDQTLEKGSANTPRVIDNSCLTCHLDTILRVGFPNHFHNKLQAAYTAWRRGAALIAPEGNSEGYRKDLDAGLTLVQVNITCVDCHKGHVSTSVDAAGQFLDLNRVVYPECEQCHLSELGRKLGLGANEEP